MQELMAQRGGLSKFLFGSQQTPEQQKAQEEAKSEADERRQMMPSQILSSQARERLARITLVKPEKARGVEDVILRAAQMGQIVEKEAIFGINSFQFHHEMFIRLVLESANRPRCFKSRKPKCICTTKSCISRILLHIICLHQANHS
ncbi:putative PDCD5-like superfamily protein [Helianthus debilis subsp. tardiflorus]